MAYLPKLVRLRECFVVYVSYVWKEKEKGEEEDAYFLGKKVSENVGQ